MSLDSEESEKIKVLVVDDQTLFAEGTVSLLSVESRILTLGIAKSGSECMNIVDKIMLDVVLLDIELPDACGVDLIDMIKKVQPEVKIIMLTGHSPKGYVTRSISKNADGFLLKNCSVEEMIEGIISVYCGGVYFSKGLKAFLPVINNNSLNSSSNSEMFTELLTHKEIEIAELVSKGLRNKEIASAMGINVRTVEFHMSNILSKLGVNNRFEAVLIWANYKRIFASIGDE